MNKSIVTALSISIVLLGCVSQPIYQCDSSKPETTPTNLFEINRTDGTAVDKNTKLTWKICSEGQSYSDGHCTGNATKFTWDNAMQTFGENGDNWRLPNVDELESIVEGQCQTPAINIAVFPNTPPSSFWSSSLDVTNPAKAWYVSFYYGSLYNPDKTVSYNVRLVRGKEWINLLKEGKRRQAELDERQMREAEQDAFVICNDKTSCDKAFSLTQIYIHSLSSQKIQVATDTIIETYNPAENGNIGMSAVKIPGKGSSASIRLTVICKVDDKGIYDKLCGLKKKEIYIGFRPFINKMHSD